MTKTLLTVGILACALGAGCSTIVQDEGSTPQLVEDDVIAIANAKATQEGFDLSKYYIDGCHYEFTRPDRTWTVFFVLKPPTPPGGHFLVWVDDRTKEATLMRGE